MCMKYDDVKTDCVNYRRNKSGTFLSILKYSNILRQKRYSEP